MLLVGWLPCKDLVFGIRRMKTKHFTATVVHCGPETCLERKKIWTHDHLQWLEHSDSEHIGKRDQLDLRVSDSWFQAPFSPAVLLFGGKYAPLTGSYFIQEEIGPLLSLRPGWAKNPLVLYWTKPGEETGSLTSSLSWLSENFLDPLIKLSILHLPILTQWLTPATEGEHHCNTNMVCITNSPLIYTLNNIFLY